MSAAALTDAGFAAAIAAPAGVLVVFSADWCAPCRDLSGQLAKLQAARPKLRVATLDLDANPDTPLAQRINAVPSLVLYRGGIEVARRVGACPAATLIAWLDSHAPKTKAKGKS